MKSHHGLLLVLSSSLVGCLPISPNLNPPIISQLQIRTIQTRSYEGVNQKTVLKPSLTFYRMKVILLIMAIAN